MTRGTRLLVTLQQLQKVKTIEVEGSALLTPSPDTYDMVSGVVAYVDE